MCLDGPQLVIVLLDSATDITTALLVIRKVYKGKISNEDCGPVNQMWKIALHRVDPEEACSYESAKKPCPCVVHTCEDQVLLVGAQR